MKIYYNNDDLDDRWRFSVVKMNAALKRPTCERREKLAANVYYNLIVLCLCCVYRLLCTHTNGTRKYYDVARTNGQSEKEEKKTNQEKKYTRWTDFCITPHHGCTLL